MSNRLLPIGTVVQLKNSTARVMVAGYLSESAARPGYVWDYTGFKFPIGYVNNNEIYCFDQEQIEQIFALGYQDSEQFAFSNKLSRDAEKIKADKALMHDESADGQEEK